MAAPNTRIVTENLQQQEAQHYVPKFYLKGFTDPQGCLWVCEKHKPIRASKPKLEANRPDYYTHTEKGERDTSAENDLQQVESRAAPIIRRLANPQFEIKPAELGDLYLFVAFMFVRVPSWREHLDTLFTETVKREQIRTASDKESFHKRCLEIEEMSGKPLGDYERLRQYILKGEYRIIQESRAFNLASMFDSGITVARLLQSFSYEILYAPKESSFLTSDSPVFTVMPDGKGTASIGMGFGWRDVQVHFPLNKRACLRLRRGVHPSAVWLHPRSMSTINKVIMATATRYAYSSQGLRRIGRLFDLYGCKVRPGETSFVTRPPKDSEIKLL